MKKIKKVVLILVFIIQIVVGKAQLAYAEETRKCENADDIVVVLDVSGSMASTDTERLAFETIELLVRMSEPEDRIAIVAFNETIVYQAGLTFIEDEQSIATILSDLQSVAYQGNTDNGLGLSTGLRLLQEEQKEERNQIMIFISDGKIDLPNQKEGRTETLSKQDMDVSIQVAMEEKIPIYTFGFSSSEPEIIDELTAIATATHAANYICKGPLQMMSNVLEIAMLYKEEHDSLQTTVKLDGSLQKYELELDKEKRASVVFQASEEIIDFEVIATEINYTVTNTRHCRIVEFEEKQDGVVTLCYRTEKQGNAIVNDVRFVISEEPMIIEYPKIDIAIENTKFPKIQTQYGIAVKNDNNFWMAIAFLIVATMVICIGIVYAFFHKRKPHKKQAELDGYLMACFIDLKSKNDIPSLVWNLREYPPEGVTLKELFAGSGIQEDLPQLEQICLYPNEEGKGLTLVHCTEGGIFVDDKTITKNIPATVKYGETIYVGFPENASEFSLKYQQTKEEV